MPATRQQYDDLDDVRRKLKTAKIKLARLPADADPEKKATLTKHVKELQTKRDELYTGDNGIGRRKKERAGSNLNTGLAPQNPTLCVICLDEIGPGDAARTSFCHPIGHTVHKECWALQTDRQKETCCICKQREIDPIRLLRLYACFPTESREFSPESFLQNPDLSWFNHAGVGVAKSFARGEISDRIFSYLTAPANAPRTRNTLCASAASALA